MLQKSIVRIRFLLWELTHEKNDIVFSLASGIAVVVQQRQTKQRIVMKKHSLKLMMFEINTTDAREFQKSHEIVASFIYKWNEYDNTILCTGGLLLKHL